jgi:hypothetical protein
MKLTCEYDTAEKVEKSCLSCYSINECTGAGVRTCQHFIPKDWNSEDYNCINGSWYKRKKVEWHPM